MNETVWLESSHIPEGDGGDGHEGILFLSPQTLPTEAALHELHAHKPRVSRAQTHAVQFVPESPRWGL